MQDDPNLSITGLIDQYTSRRVDRRRFLKGIAALGLSASSASALLAACGGENIKQPSKGRLRAHLEEDIGGNLDPAFQAGHIEYIVTYNIFENLVAHRQGTFEPVNQLAKKWEGSEDGLRWDFELKKGIQFHGDYGELTADDVKFSFERIAGLTEPKLDSPYQSDWAALEEVKVTGKYTGSVILEEPYAPLMTTTIPEVAGQIVSKRAVLELGDKFATEPIGTGPYEFVRWDRNQRILLKKFAQYGGAIDYAPPPVWKEIEFIIISEDNPTEIALESGKLDFALLPTSAIDRFKDNDQFQVTKKTSLDYNWIGMNVQHENLKDKNTRLAVRYGIDVPAIIEAAFDGRWTQASAIIAPGMPVGYWKEAPVYEPDVQKAKQYLKKANAQGRKIQMAVDVAEPGADVVAEVVQQNLKQVGFNVNVQIQESGTFTQTTQEANAKRQLFYTGFTTNPDPHWSTLWFTCDQVGVWNWMSWCNEEYSQLDKRAVQTIDQNRLQEIYVDMQKIMDEDVPAVWVAWPTHYFAAKRGLRPTIRPDGRIIAWDFRLV
jgi:peptide/nickel transport system substrate-binding protein